MGADMHRVPVRLLGLAGLVGLGLAACDLGLPTAVVEPLSVGEAELWPDVISVASEVELALTVAVPDGSTVTGAPVRWTSSDTTVVKIIPAEVGTGAGAQAGNLRATMVGVGRGSARITVVMDPLAGFEAPTLEHDVQVWERWVDVTGGAYFTCGITYSRDAYCWGSGDLGELGNGGSTGGFPDPQPVAGDLKFTALDGGWDHTCGRAVSGLLHCWGFNFAGELGTGNALSQFVPTQVALGRAFGSVTAGNGLTCGLLGSLARGDGGDDDWALCWGDNEWGQVGSAHDELVLQFPDTEEIVGAVIDDPDFGPIFVELFFSSVSASGNFACGIVAFEFPGAWCWGDNSRGQLGNGDFDDGGSFVASPVVGPRFDVVATSLGSVATSEPDEGERMHACALTPGGALWCWGSNDRGQLGSGITSDIEPFPVASPSGVAFEQLSLGEGHSCGLDGSGTIYCWGRNDFGQVGNGRAGDAVLEPVAIAIDRTFTKVSAGAYHTCGLTGPDDGGAIYCWGRNTGSFGREAGQLGDGTFAHRAVPTRVVESSVER